MLHRHSKWFARPHIPQPYGLVGTATGYAPLVSCLTAVITYLVCLVLFGVLNREEDLFLRTMFGAFSAEARS